MPEDLLRNCLTLLSLAQLVNSKCVCKVWASAIRLTIREWRSRGANEEIMARVPARYDVYESAEQAFAALRAANRLDKRLVTRKCKEIAAIYDLLQTRLGIKAEDVLPATFKHEPLAKLFMKKMRVVQQAGTDRIVIFSDTYHVDAGAFNSFALKCNEAGLEVFAFEWNFPGLMFHDDNCYYPPQKSMLATGYSKLYRGKLAGFMV